MRKWIGSSVFRCLILLVPLLILRCLAQDACKDVHSTSDCRIYKQSGRCSTNPWFQENCAKTCGFCQPLARLFFTRHPTSQVATKGDNITFQCEVKSLVPSSKIIYLWKFNHSYIKENSSRGFYYSQERTTLHVLNVTENIHYGAYECIALSDGVGSIKSIPATLKMAYFRTEVQHRKLIRVKLTQPYLIQLPAYKSFPVPEFVWEFKDNTGNFISVSRDPNLFVTERGDLLIPSVSASHQATFRVFIKHQTANPNYAATFLYIVRISGNANPCNDASIFTYPAAEKRNASVGENVSFECLAVAKDCRSQISITWTKQDTGNHISSNRKISFYDVQKDKEGIYNCYVEVIGQGSSRQFSFILQVIEKPKLTQATSAKVNLTSAGILYPATFSGVVSFSWYKDGEIINNRSNLFRVYADRRLKVLNPSRGLSGLYQMFYTNEAGTVDVTQEVSAPSVGCGWTAFGANGKIEFNNAGGTKLGIGATCTWLIRLGSSIEYEFTFTAMDFPESRFNCSETTLSIYSESTASMAPVKSYCATTAKPIPTAYVNGPFVIISLMSKSGNFKKDRFVLKYRPAGQKVSSGTPIKTVSSVSSDAPSVTTAMSRLAHTTILSTTLMAQRKTALKESSMPLGAILGGVFGGLVFFAVIAAACFRKDLTKRITRQKSLQIQANMDSLPRFEVARNGVINQIYEGVPKKTQQKGNPLKHEVPDSNLDYDAVGAVLNSGFQNSPQDETDVYDEVGGVIKSCQRDLVSHGVPHLSQNSKSSSTKSEPYYHQLADGQNIAYVPANDFKGCLRNDSNSDHSNKSSLSVARVPSGRSDTHYTALGDEATLAAKENSIYECLTLDRVKGSSMQSGMEPRALGEYCEPYDGKIDAASGVHDRSFRGQSCVLYESGDMYAREPADGGLYAEYSEPYEAGDFVAAQEEQIYSEAI